jgi:hypothetical protein
MRGIYKSHVLFCGTEKYSQAMCNVSWTLTKESTKHSNSLKVVIENVRKDEFFGKIHKIGCHEVTEYSLLYCASV